MNWRGWVALLAVLLLCAGTLGLLILDPTSNVRPTPAPCPIQPDAAGLISDAIEHNGLAHRELDRLRSELTHCQEEIAREFGERRKK